MKKHFIYLLLAWLCNGISISLLLFISFTSYSDTSIVKEGNLIPVTLTLLISGGFFGLTFSSLASYFLLLSASSKIKKILISLFAVLPCIFISCTFLYTSFLFLTGM